MKPFVILGAISLVLAGCSGESATSQEPPVIVESTVEASAPESSSPSMSDSEAAAWYEDAICTNNRFSPVRRELFAQAEKGSDSVQLVQDLAAAFESDGKQAAEMLRNPPAPWPAAVSALVTERADLLEDAAELNVNAAEVSTAEQYLAWHEETVAFVNDSNRVGEAIQTALGIEGITCPEPTDPEVLAALQQLATQPEGLPGSGFALAIECYGLDDDDRDFVSLQAFFTAVEDGWNPDFCSTDIEDFSESALTEDQQRAIELYGSRFDDGPPDIEDTFTMLIDNCAQNPQEGYGDMLGAQATLLMCPESPFADQIAEFSEGNLIVGDGTHIVGKDISPGTFVTTDSVGDCYWERVDGNGGTLANDFITFAPNGAKVTVKKSDGALVTENCYSWRKES